MLDVNVEAINRSFLDAGDFLGSADHTGLPNREKNSNGSFNMVVFEHPSFFIDPKAPYCFQFLWEIVPPSTPRLKNVSGRHRARNPYRIAGRWAKC